MVILKNSTESMQKKMSRTRKLTKINLLKRKKKNSKIRRIMKSVLTTNSKMNKPNHHSQDKTYRLSQKRTNLNSIHFKLLLQSLQKSSVKN